MQTIELQTILNDGNVPALNPVANLTALNALDTTFLLIGSTCEVKDTKTSYYFNGTFWENLEKIEWFPLPATSQTDWFSNAFIALINNGTLAITRGFFTALVNNADITITTLPVGFIPATIAVGSRIVPISKSNISQQIYTNSVQWEGGLNTMTINVAGVIATDEIFAMIKNPGSSPSQYSVSAHCNANETVTFELQNANPANDIVIAYEIKRPQLLMSGQLTTGLNYTLELYTPMNLGDIVDFNFIIYPMG